MLLGSAAVVEKVALSYYVSTNTVIVFGTAVIVVPTITGVVQRSDRTAQLYRSTNPEKIMR